MKKDHNYTFNTLNNHAETSRRGGQATTDRFYTVDGKLYTCAQLAEMTGLSTSSVRQRMRTQRKRKKPFTFEIFEGDCV